LEDEEASEGRVLTRVHRLRERNQSIVKKKKKSVLEKTGRLECEVCSFDFFQEFGNLGNGYAECHHEVPVSELKPNQKTKLSELRIVCANCHRMIHRRRPWLSLAQLRDVKGKSQ
jgi:5-methylcytosine-specific restriction protein A